MSEPNGTAAQPFEPARFISKVGGSDYLEVKWRLVWLREQDRDATIDTELIRADDKSATFKATIQRTSGGRATGYGSETAGDFRDFLEKAETKAIGRALAALGFGTQFCADHDFGSARGRVVDSPVNRTRQERTSGPQPVEGRGTNPAERASDRHYRYLQATAREAGVTQEELDRRAQRDYSAATAQQLSRADMSSLIDVLSAERDDARKAAPHHAPPAGRPNTDERPDRSPKITPQHLATLHAQGAKTFGGDKDVHARIKGQAYVRFRRTSLNDLTQYECARLLGYMEAGDIVDEVAIPA